jgi:hypothetical protein
MVGCDGLWRRRSLRLIAIVVAKGVGVSSKFGVRAAWSVVAGLSWRACARSPLAAIRHAATTSTSAASQTIEINKTIMDI